MPLPFDRRCLFSVFIFLLMIYQMVLERQRIEAAPAPTVETAPPPPPPPFYEEVNNAPTAPMQNGSNDGVDYFLGEVIIQISFKLFHNFFCCNKLNSFLLIFFIVFQAIFSYFAESDVELNLSTGDFVVIRKVCSS